MASKSNMSLQVSIKIDGKWENWTSTSAHAHYSCTGGKPTPGAGVVDIDGNIDLSKLDPGTTYSSATDITFTIDPASNFTDKGGAKMNLSFPTDGTQIVVAGQDVGRSAFRMGGALKPDSLTFTDMNNLVGEYLYLLIVNSQYPNDKKANSFTFILDPNIVNKPQ